MSELASYKRGYDDCKEEMLSVIENIKAEIESHIIESNGLDFNSALYIALEVIDKHIGGK